METPKSDASSTGTVAGLDDSSNDEGRPIDVEGDELPRKRQKLQRLLPDQVRLLRHAFQESSRLSKRRMEELSKRANLSARQVEVWFQNERARIRSRKELDDLRYFKKLYVEQKKAVTELEQSNKELRELLSRLQRRTPEQTPTEARAESVPEFTSSQLVVIKRDGRLLRASNLLRQVLGFPDTEHDKVGLFHLIYAEDQTAVTLDQVLKGSILTVHMRIRLKAYDGSDVWTQWKAYSLSSSQGDTFLVAYVSVLPSA
mmetsp:Transcript_37630/g.60977  ORF Transcript_37630/g.60977 Transcript_37630/m.60977 type:complete len:258 (-) Transcript_37630:276-1049(-)|eukprot:CAMPEP_0184672676 /NCGR_PEP_ID=MMETSP0308-20130426/86241_1 /TAXON_ID=38269 /ORGANISM="Gloeochaete witrockiana, Strain SAG 46.84" /LENGTH=257 /DNA_ID=CAMNT_0027120053 /DNA_START=157 /DNA_END=930 /DNA_ORIENTATION=-